MENGLIITTIIIITTSILVYLRADSTVWWQYRFKSNKKNYVKTQGETRSKTQGNNDKIKTS
jgi:hypothetical protein